MSEPATCTTTRPIPSRKKWASPPPYNVWGFDRDGSGREPMPFAGCRTYREARELIAGWHEKFPTTDYWIVTDYLPARTAPAVDELDGLVRRTMAKALRDAADRVERG